MFEQTLPMTPDEAMGHNWASPTALLGRMIGNPPEVLKQDGVKFLVAQGLTVQQVAKAFGIPAQQVMEIRNKHDWRNSKLTGRKTPIAEEKLEAIRQARTAGKKLDEIKNELHVGMSTIYKALGKPATLETTAPVLETAPEMADKSSLAAAELPALKKQASVLETHNSYSAGTVSFKKYKPLASPDIMVQCRDEMEEMLNSLDADTRIALDDGDYSIACELIRQMQAVSLSIDLISAELERCG